MLISAEHLSINFGSRQLLDDVDFYLNEGDKTGVIGINGTGKSTFLKVLAGKLQPDGGTIARKPNLQVSVLAQNPDMRDELTVLEQVFASMPPEFRQLNEYEAKRMLTQLGLADTDRRIGTLSGLPYTVAEELKMMFFTPWFLISSQRIRVPVMLL